MINPPPPIRNLHSTIILISITILNPLTSSSSPLLQITPTHSLTPPPYSINHQHPTTLNPAR